MFVCAKVRNVVFLNRGPKKEHGGKDAKYQAKPSWPKAEVPANKPRGKTPAQECFTCGRQHPGTCNLLVMSTLTMRTCHIVFQRLANGAGREAEKKPDDKMGFKKSIICTICTTKDTTISTTEQNNSTQVSIKMILTPLQETRELSVLLDTGASSDYVSEEFSDWLIGQGVEVENANHVVCSGFIKEVCRKCKGKIEVTLTYTTEIDTVKTLRLTLKKINTS